MTMTYKTVEEYLEVIGGYRDPVTLKPDTSWLFSIKPIVSLARYDVKVLESMIQTVSNNQPLTGRQGELACKIVLKYARQLANKSIDVKPVETPVWRMPLRSMDYSQRAWIENDQLLLKFPYNNKYIEDIRDFAKVSQGSVAWDRENKIWTFALTEYNVSWAHTWAVLNQFEIDASLAAVMNQITQVEQQPYAIELQIQSGLAISNASTALNTYIQEHLGGFATDNLMRLIDHAPILGYTLATDLADAVVSDYGPRFYNLLISRELKIDPSSKSADDDLESVLDYARAIGRTPVVLYEPDLSDKIFNRVSELYPGQVEKIVDIKNAHLSTAQFIHTTKPVLTLDRIPLVVSTAGMIFGGDKQVMLQKAEKVVYCTTDVYNKNKNSNSKIANL
jgi:hypothetical protein